MPAHCTDPGPLVSLFAADPEVHLYGLADLEEPYWSVSRWWIEGDAAVGIIGFPGSSSKAIYAMSGQAPHATLDLLVSTADELPEGALATGPLGLADRMRTVWEIRELGAHWRLVHDGREAFLHDGVEELTVTDLEALRTLHATDPGATFFVPNMVAEGVYVGIRDGGRLLASAGTHVISDRHGVAAIGAVITDPAERGRGLGAAVTEHLTALLAPRVSIVGLNVAEVNERAVRLYERLGFVRSFRYEEIELTGRGSREADR